MYATSSGVRVCTSTSFIRTSLSPFLGEQRKQFEELNPSHLHTVGLPGPSHELRGLNPYIFFFCLYWGSVIPIVWELFFITMFSLLIVTAFGRKVVQRELKHVSLMTLSSERIRVLNISPQRPIVPGKSSLPSHLLVLHHIFNLVLAFPFLEIVDNQHSSQSYRLLAKGKKKTCSHLKGTADSYAV